MESKIIDRGHGPEIADTRTTAFELIDTRSMDGIAIALLPSSGYLRMMAKRRSTMYASTKKR